MIRASQLELYISIISLSKQPTTSHKTNSRWTTWKHAYEIKKIKTPLLVDFESAYLFILMEFIVNSRVQINFILVQRMTRWNIKAGLVHFLVSKFLGTVFNKFSLSFSLHSLLSETFLKTQTEKGLRLGIRVPVAKEYTTEV